MKRNTKYGAGVERFNRIHTSTNILFNIVFLTLAIACILPLLAVVSIAFSSEKAIQEFGYSLWPREISAESFKFLWRQRTVLFRSLGISLFVTIVGTVIGTILTTSTGYVLSRPQYRLRNFLTWIVFIPMVFSGGMVSSYFVNVNLLGLKNNVWALIFPLMVSPFNIIVCRTFFRTTVPDSLIESAKIDGASQLTIYFRIVLPISLPVFATISLFLSFAYWNDWFQSMLYIDDIRLNSLQALLTQIMGNVDYLSRNASTMGISAAELARTMPKEGARMAIAMIIVFPIACAYPFFQKYFITGLTIVAVKG